MYSYKHVFCIGIGGIGISSLARFYRNQGSFISGSDTSENQITQDLILEGVPVFFRHHSENLVEDVDLVIYSEAIITRPDLSSEENLASNPELFEARKRGIECLSYPQALASIFNHQYGIAISGSHGKSTTTAMLGTLLAQTPINAHVVVGTRVPQFDDKNYHIGTSSTMVIEACEYKHSFYQYHPKMAIITNIDLDHTDFYKSLEDYIESFVHFARQVTDVLVLSSQCKNSRRMYEILIQGDIYPKKILWLDTPSNLPNFQLQVPGEHLLQDAGLVFLLARELGLNDDTIINGLESYQGCWRRSEKIGTLSGGSLLFSDYGHHPNEIRPTIHAFREKYPDYSIISVFQPHQYARTREFLEEFAQSFGESDAVIIPNVYFSRDKQDDIDYCTPERILTTFQKYHSQVQYAGSLEKTRDILQSHNKPKTLILLQGAGDVDSLRFQLPLSYQTPA